MSQDQEWAASESLPHSSQAICFPLVTQRVGEMCPLCRIPFVQAPLDISAEECIILRNNNLGRGLPWKPTKAK
jgi:hypothetical protein